MGQWGEVADVELMISCHKCILIFCYYKLFIKNIVEGVGIEPCAFKRRACFQDRMLTNERRLPCRRYWIRTNDTRKCYSLAVSRRTTWLIFYLSSRWESNPLKPDRQSGATAVMRRNVEGWKGIEPLTKSLTVIRST